MLSKLIQYVFQGLIFIIPFSLPLFQFHADNSTLLTAVSLLFAILVGFFIATTTSNYLRLQTLIADANASLISIFNLVKSIDPDKKPEIGEAVDEYMIASLDFELLDYARKTKKEFNQVIKVSDETEPKDQKGFALLSELHTRMDDLLTNDQEIALTAKQIVTPRHWFIIVSLSILLSLSLLSFRDGTMLVSLFISIMLIAIYHILYLIHEIDTNLFLSRQLSFEDPQQVFEGIGRLPYYPKCAIDKGYVRPTTKSYRVGIYKNPSSLEKDITVVGSTV